VIAAPEVPEPVSGQGTTTDDREVETAVNAQKPRESGECQTTAGGNSGDGQTGDNHINGTISSRRRQTRQTDNDTSNARDANRAELLTDTCQVVTRNACELAADEKQITDAQINLLDVDTRSELMRSPDGAIGNATNEGTDRVADDVIKRDRKQIRRTSEPSQRAETQTVKQIEQWRTEDATKISKRIDSNIDTDDLIDMRMQSEKRARTERDSNENRVINYERMKTNRDINSSDVTEKSACKLNETDTTDCEETVKIAPDEKTSFTKITENKDAFDNDRSYNRRLYKHELGGVYSRNMYGGDERPKRKRNVGLSRLSINTKTLACKMRITSMIKCKIKSRSGTKKEEMRHHTTV